MFEGVVFGLALRFGAGLGAARAVFALLAVVMFEGFGLRIVMFCEVFCRCEIDDKFQKGACEACFDSFSLEITLDF